jgi:hypothetical protein
MRATGDKLFSITDLGDGTGGTTTGQQDWAVNEMTMTTCPEWRNFHQPRRFPVCFVPASLATWSRA